MNQLRYFSCSLVWFLYFQLFTVDSTENILKIGTGKPWNGGWFPFKPGHVDMNPVTNETKHTAPIMSQVDPECDNGQRNLSMDWDGSTWAHTCYMPRILYRPDPKVNPMLRCDHIPAEYSAIHVCMNTSITYEWTIPTYGAHRPIWARYGEYNYVPRQRWLHNLEHGAVVMLYHPCTDPEEVSRLKNLVKGCLFRYVITPDRLVSEHRPLVLVTWGCRFEMSYVHAASVRAFIMVHALHGLEAIAHDGEYSSALLHPAAIVSDAEDSNLCPGPITHM